MKERRTEAEMFALILDTARADERIRAVILNGSRADPNAPRDRLQDFDIVYLVTEVAPLAHNLAWLERFGERIILQMPDAMGDPPAEGGTRFAYLMQFADGNRLDLTLLPVARANELPNDSLSVLLLDKDGIVPPLSPPSDRDYLPKPPTATAFADCCNEFWWVAPYVAKGLWRREIPYAKAMLDGVLREQLFKLLSWYVGIRFNFARSIGKEGKYLERLLEPELWAQLERTYADAAYAHNWDALFVMCELFRTVAVQVAEAFGFDYPAQDDERVSAYLRHIRALPRS